LLALNQANATGNYSVFREMGAPGFQVANSTARLSETFTELRNRNFDLSPIVVLQPKLIRKPEIDKGGMLRITGFFPTRPERLNFDLIYQSLNGQWRLFGIATNTTPIEPVATAGAKPQPAPEAPKNPAAVPATPAPPAKSSAEADKGASAKPAKPNLADIRDKVDQIEEATSASMATSTPSNDLNPLSPFGSFR
jgi:hypothetical protein